MKISEQERLFFCTRKPLEDTNFTTFYVAHRAFIDDLIGIWSFEYRFNYDLDDIHQEVLYRLQVNRILEQYDHTRAQLNTFLTLKIKNYIRHVVRDLPALFGNPESFNSNNQVERAEFEEFNELSHSKEEDPLEPICFRENLKKLKEMVSPQLWELVCMLRLGMTILEIAQRKKVSRSCISYKYLNQLKKQAVWKIFHEVP